MSRAFFSYESSKFSYTSQMSVPLMLCQFKFAPVFIFCCLFHMCCHWKSQPLFLPLFPEHFNERNRNKTPRFIDNRLTDSHRSWFIGVRMSIVFFLIQDSGTINTRLSLIDSNNNKNNNLDDKYEDIYLEREKLR